MLQEKLVIGNLSICVRRNVYCLLSSHSFLHLEVSEGLTEEISQVMVHYLTPYKLLNCLWRSWGHVFCAGNHLEITGGISHWQPEKHHLITDTHRALHPGLRVAWWVPRDASFSWHQHSFCVTVRVQRLRLWTRDSLLFFLFFHLAQNTHTNTPPCGIPRLPSCWCFYLYHKTWVAPKLEHTHSSQTDPW